MDLERRIETALADLEAAGNLRTLRTVVPEGIYLRHEGKRYLNLSSNDYLGLSASAYAGVDVRSYAARVWGQERLSTFAHGNPASRLMTGNSAEYDIVEEEIEKLFPERAALVLGCGFMANSGLMPALAERGDLILADKLVHASIIEGLQHTNADFRRFPHNDVAALEQQLQRAAAGEGKNIWVIIESLYSMDGDLAPLAAIVELKKKYGFYLNVDEAHSFGVRGPQGKGYAAELGLESEVDLMVVTFGKALAGAGAAVICSPLLRRWLINRMRPLIFSTALPPVTLLWDALVLHEMRTESLKNDHFCGTDSLRAHLAELIKEFSAASGIPAESHIIPLPCGSNERALAVAKEGQSRELWLTAIRHPTVPQGTARIRLSLNAGMTKKNLSPLLDLCKKIG